MGVGRALILRNEGGVLQKTLVYSTLIMGWCEGRMGMRAFFSSVALVVF